MMVQIKLAEGIRNTNFLVYTDMEKQAHKAKEAQIIRFMALPVTRPGNVSVTRITISGLRAIVPNPTAQNRTFPAV